MIIYILNDKRYIINIFPLKLDKNYNQMMKTG